MGIYFGNLDRQLADRQQVLKEDAERQYRGMKDIRQAFGGLGDAFSAVLSTSGWRFQGGIFAVDLSWRFCAEVPAF